MAQMLERLAEHKRWLETDGREGTRFVVPTEELRNLSFDGDDLRKADLSKGRFISTSFKNADLREADLTDAEIVEGDFAGADLRGASIGKKSFIRVKSLWNAKLDNATIHDVEFEGQRQAPLPDLRNTSFKGARILNVLFKRADLTCSLFSGAIISESTFSNCDLRSADFSRSQMTNVRFSDCKMAFTDIRHLGSEPMMSAARFEEARILRNRFEKNSMRGCSFTNADLRSSVFKKCDLADVRFDNANLRWTRFIRNELRIRAVFKGKAPYLVVPATEDPFSVLLLAVAVAIFIMVLYEFLAR